MQPTQRTCSCDYRVNVGQAGSLSISDRPAVNPRLQAKVALNPPALTCRNAANMARLSVDKALEIQHRTAAYLDKIASPSQSVTLPWIGSDQCNTAVAPTEANTRVIVIRYMNLVSLHICVTLVTRYMPFAGLRGDVFIIHFDLVPSFHSPND